MGCMFLYSTPVPNLQKAGTNPNCHNFPSTSQNNISPSISFPFLLPRLSSFSVNCRNGNDDLDQKLSSSSAYDVLGVDPGCSASELKSAFRARVKEFHPDLRRNQRNSDVMIRLIIQAYEMLSNYRRSDVIDSCRECLDPFEEPECEAIDIFVNESLCIGKGCPYACVQRAPHAFAFSATGTARATSQGHDDDYKVQLAVGQCPANCIHYVTPSQRAILEELLDGILNLPYDTSAEAELLYALLVKGKYENNRYRKPKKQPKTSTKHVDWF